jgi:hypothetical protein
LKGFKIAALNLASLIKHIDELRINMSSNFLDILVINETRLDDTIDQSEYQIDDYTIITKNRDRRGGGVAMYIKNNINFAIRTDLQDHVLEFLCLEIRKPKVKPFSHKYMVQAPKFTHSAL